LLVVNEVEARVLGRHLDRYGGLLVTTYGSRGAVLSREGKVLASATPPKVEVVDTTGAGDAFTAALTVALVGGMDAGRALDLACRCGALATTRAGAQSSPHVQELENF